MNKKGMIDTRPLIVLYLVLIVALIFTHYLTFSFPSSIRLINKPWSLPEEIVIGIMIAPIMLLILLFPVAYIEEKHAESMAKKMYKKHGTVNTENHRTKHVEQGLSLSYQV